MIVMKKILSRIFSVVLVAATVASPSMAQFAKKAVAPKSTAKTAVAAPAQKAPAKPDKNSILNPNKVQTRSFGEKSSSPFATPRSSAKGLKTTTVKAPAKEAANMPALNGVIVYNDNIDSTEECGLFELPLNGNSSGEPIVTGFTANGCVVVDGFLYGFGYTTFWGYIMSIDLYEVDIEGGEIANHYTFDSQDYIINTLAQDPTTGTIYGIGYNAAGSGLEFKKVELDGESTSLTVIAACDRNWNTITFDKDGQLWGISYDGESQDGSYVVTSSALCKIDKATGAVTEVGETGVAPQYMSSGCIDKTTGRFFWNVNPADETGWMYEVNLTSGAATPLYQLKDNDEIMGMYVPAPLAEDGAPAVCENVEVVFNEDALTGNVNLTAPAKLFDGSNGSGDVTIHVLVDDQDLTATAAYGAEVAVPVTLDEAGLYTFVVYASNAAGDGPKTRIKNQWIGADTPEATSATLAYEDGTMTVSWEAVTASVNGGYINLDNITYTVLDMEDEVKASGLTGTSWSEEIAEPEEITKFQYQVVVVCDGNESEPALTNPITLGSIVPPYTSDFAENGLEGWTLIDGNGDNKVWTVYNGNIRMQWNSSLNMDDWAITVPIKLEAGKAYSFSFSTWAYSANYPERLEVKYGKTPTAAGMTETILEPTDITVTDADPLNVEKMIIPETTGTYYIGFHGISDKDEFYLYLSNFTIGEGVAATAPGLGEIEAVADASGALSVNVNVKFASTTMGGDALTSLTKAELYRGTTLIKTFENPAVGGTDSYTDAPSTNGDVEYSLVCYNENGKGLVATASTFVGFAKPSPLESATIARTNTTGEVVVSWTPVTTDINGKTYPAGSVKYKVCEYNSGWVPFTDFLDGDSYTYQAVEAGEQDFIQVAVFPFYESVNGTGDVTDMIPVGTPYAGLDETFADGKIHYSWIYSSGATEYGEGGGSVSLCTGDTYENLNGVNDDNGYLQIKASYLEGSALFISGMVDLSSLVNPGFTFYVYNISNGTNPDVNLANVYVKDLSSDSDEWVAIYSKPVNEICGAASAEEIGEEGWGKATVSLGAYAGKTIQIGVEGVVKYYSNNFFDNMKVGNILGHDLKAAGISAPAKVKVGEPYTVDVRVSNEGAQNVASYSVELYADDDLVATEVCTDLAPGTSTTVSFDCVMSPVAQEAISYYAKVVYADDEAPADNTTDTIVVAPIVSTLPAATDLEGSSTAEGIKLTWNEPNLEGGVVEPVTDDFEDADSFAAEYGDWTFVDKDDKAVGGFQNLDVPGIVPGSTTGSFWIWDNDELGNQTFAAHSGSKYLFALFRSDDGTTDDWAISPELCGDAQTISFFAKSYSTEYPEKIEVYYTTSPSVNPDDYVQVGATVNPVPGDWTEYSYDLPSGATHFAIRSCATGSFMLMVDDVTYAPASGSSANLELKGYNVYRDGVKINDALVEETEFVDTNVVEGQQYTYIVTAVYEGRGESALSNEAVVTYAPVGIADVAAGKVAVSVENNNLVVLNAADKNVVISSANGAVIYSGAGEARTVVPVGKGVYVVKVDKTVKKVIVK